MSKTVVGLAGHIDHGKTSIIKSLTGTQTERYAEELERGLTIDIGFAFLNEDIALIDVPGHEKFIKNMLTGSFGIDLAVLVVAADDGIMPQTKEHFEILKLLNIENGLIVLNKIDLVDDDWITLLIDDIQSMVKGSFLESSNIIQTSTVNNLGIQELSNEISASCKNISPRYDRGFFRMAVDRSFTIKGYGTVATGTVTSGSISTGDTIDVMPNGKQYKIRGIHTQGESVDTVSKGARAAINIGNLDVNHIIRGCQISSPGYLMPSNRLIIRCRLLDNIKKTLKQNQRVRFHIGTSELIGRVSLVDVKELNPSEESLLLIKLESKVIATMGDKFILRTFSPLSTIGGGTVVDIFADPKWKQNKTDIMNLKGLNENRIKIYIIGSQKFKPLSYEESRIRFGLGDTQIDDFINLNSDSQIIKYKSKSWLVLKPQLEECKNKIVQILKSSERKYDIGLSKSLILQKTDGDEKFIDYLLADLQASSIVYKKNEKWIIKGVEITLDDDDKILSNQLLNILNKEGFVTSSLEDLSINNNCNQERTKKILNVLEKNSKVIRLNETLIFSMQNMNDLKKHLDVFFRSNKVLSMKDFKEIADTTRKYAVPLLEYFDKIKYTFRVEDGRKLF